MKSLETFHRSDRPDEQKVSHESEKSRKAEFVFTPTTFAEENLDDIIDTLHDCNIVAVAYAGGSLGERAQDEHDLNVLSSLNVPVDSKRESLERLRDQGTSEFLIELSADLGKMIVLIDVSDGHAAEEVLRVSDEALDDFLTSIDQYQPINVLRTKMMDYIRADVRASAVREHEMARQLEFLGDENTEAKIGVVMGSIHTPVQHEIAKKFRMKRSFISMDETVPKPEKKRFSYEEELSRHYRMAEGQEVKPSLVNRALLETFFRGEGYSGEGIHSIRIQVMDHMSDEDVEQALAEIGRVREWGFGTHNPAIDAQVEGKTKALLASYVGKFGEQ